MSRNESVLSVLSESGIYVSGLVNYRLMCVLLDTGATVSVLSESAWKKSGIVLKPEPISGRLTANGNELTVLGETEVRIRMGKIECSWPVIIVQGLAHDFVLGSDFFQHYQCQIHYDTGTLAVGDSEIPIRYRKTTPSVYRIFLCADAELEPGTEQVIRARLEGVCEQNSGSPGILEGSKELLGTSEIGIARSLVVQKAGQTLVRVANFSDKVVRLRSDLPVAEYHPVSGVNGSATPTEIGPRPSAPNHPYCSVINRNMGDDKQESTGRENRREKVIQPNSGGLSEEQKRQFYLLMDEYEGIFAMNNSDLGKSDLMDYQINTGEDAPIKPLARRIPPHQREIIDQQLDELLANGKVEESQSPWSSPVVLIRKHDGSYRMCID